MDTANLVSMKRTPAEKKASETALTETPSLAAEYDYGLSLYLGKEQLAKLGIKGLEAGQELHLCAKVVVASYTSSKSLDGYGGDSANLQITDMSLDLPNKGSTADALYGKG